MSVKISLPARNGLKRIVVVGGGFAGLRLARTIDRNYFQVILIDKNNYHQFQPLFYQVATSGLESSDISFPFRKIFQKKTDFHFRLCEAQSIDSSNKILNTSAGKLHFDYLVIATGCTTNFFGHNEYNDFVYTLKSTSESLQLRNQILQSLEDTLNKEVPGFSSELNYVIVGAGATGVELAGALGEMRRFVFPKDYPDMDLSIMNIILIDAAPRILMNLGEEDGLKAQSYLQKLGVKIITEVSVTSCDPEKVILSDGQTIYTNNIFWVAGVTGNKIDGLSNCEWGKGNRIVTNQGLKVSGTDSIFAIGDIGLQTEVEKGRGYPQVAQVAIQQAKYLARKFNRKELNSSDKFVYKDLGTMATVGRNVAIAHVGKYKFYGAFAWFMWCFVHLRSIMGVKNKIFIFINWVWNYFTYNLSLRLIIKPNPSKKKTGATGQK